MIETVDESRPRAFYFAHPVAPPCSCAAVLIDQTGNISVKLPTGLREMQVACNLKRARRWFRWLLENTDVALVASWMPYLDVVPDDGDHGVWRRRGMRDNGAIVRLPLDGIILCGGLVSPGMQEEADAMRGAGGLIVDLTHLGLEPPSTAAGLPSVLH